MLVIFIFHWVCKLRFGLNMMLTKLLKIYCFTIFCSADGFLSTRQKLAPSQFDTMDLVQVINKSLAIDRKFKFNTDPWFMRSSGSIASESATDSDFVDTGWIMPLNILLDTKKLEPICENDMISLATLRNNCTSPTQMIEKQIKKRNSIDRSKSLLNGFGVGAVVGLAVGFATFFQTDTIMDAVETGGSLGLLLGVVLDVDNAMGNRIYVMTEPEAVNRLKVDFVASILTGKDISFVAYLSPTPQVSTAKSNLEFSLATRYESSNGFVGCVDCDFRVLSTATVAPERSLHIKNMYVDPFMRRKGIARLLLKELERYARTYCDVKYLTL